MEIDGVELENRRENEETNRTVVNLKPCKKLLYFSDGVMEEFSDCEDECDTTDSTKDCENEKNMEWAAYMRFKAHKMGNKVLSGIDYVGGGLASFLGITGSEVERAREIAERHDKNEDSMDEEQSYSWNSTLSNKVVTQEYKNSN